MGLLEKIRCPADVRALGPEELPDLAAEIREFLVDAVSKTGGHIGPNLGVVELTIALHRVFESPRDRLLFDTGHQAYVHKLLTGRQEGFRLLRQRGGLSGYPSRAESEHDIIENSHASTALSYADGLAKANALQGTDGKVVALVGDGALTGGMAWEALNNIAAGEKRPVVIVVNDNGRSYSPTIGGFASHLAQLRLDPGYENAMGFVKRVMPRAPVAGSAVYEALHALKKGLKDAFTPQAMFEDLGLKYVGPIDGHDVHLLEEALRSARDFGAPVIVHCVTKKGCGYRPAESNAEDCFHGPGAFDPATGKSLAGASTSWTEVFGTEMVSLGTERSDVVAITAAMLHPTGLARFADAYPDRVFDVGIAEQHAATSAAGLAVGGLHPVVAMYATFLNRAFDQVLMDVALHRLPVTFVLDRAGVTGNDGPSHNGMWDLSILQVVPGLRIAAPRDAGRLRQLLREAVAVDDGPTVVRFPKGSVGADVEAVDRMGEMDVLLRKPGLSRVAGGPEDVLIVAVGAMAGPCVEAASLIAAHGLGVTVVDPRWAKPLDTELVGAARRYRLVATVEDNGRVGGVGDAVARMLRDAEITTPVVTLGLPQTFLDHAKREQILGDAGLTPQGIAREITRLVHGPLTATDDGQPASLHS
ncbi:1-deoxy-D-xylulose-5-phosphate synthase [Streptomyces mutabilis]|uniref:1-deoxy-D-xylulose-5-phosphate synthase n=1 Tax=Streptomyces mutabilis TaxID=67332 RepID=A0A086N7D3_9ACTN|nr:1-deoxy-D-xylulose-5-phosphate synthase [Streptomyces mutabilis]KFG77051.1 1-deoxy-D-xylulose-5-phosphate synthase [Streptomyces mutabilis]